MTNITGIDGIYGGMIQAFGDNQTTLIIIGIALVILLFLIGFNIWLGAIFLSIPVMLAAVLSIGIPMPIVGISFLILGFAAAVSWNRISQGQR